jgi:hypothetical protein
MRIDPRHRRRWQGWSATTRSTRPTSFPASSTHHAVAAAVGRAAGGPAHVENADDEHRMAEPSTPKRSGRKREAQLSGSAPVPAASS